MDAASKSVFQFSYDLLKVMLKTKENKNICYSPLSIYTVLKIVLFGAKGNTKSQMEKALHVSPDCSSSTKDCEELLKSFKELMSNQTGKQYELRMVNGAFADKAFPIEEQYLKHIKSEFDAEFQSVDFQNNAEGARQKINKWVKCQTNDKITDLFGEGSINGSSALVLANAVYYKGRWAERFNPENTTEGTFYLNKNEKKTVQMMTKSGTFKYAHLVELKCKIVVLPYEEVMCMVMILPDEIDGMQEVLSKATADSIMNLVQAKDLVETEVDVAIPKFKIEESCQLESMLTEMGMTDLFKENADLSGISSKVGLAVTSAVHKTFIDINEDGTEATAATGVGMTVTSAPIKESFTVDHPAMFCIIKKQNVLPLFTGIIFSP